LGICVGGFVIGVAVCLVDLFGDCFWGVVWGWLGMSLGFRLFFGELLGWVGCGVGLLGYLVGCWVG